MYYKGVRVAANTELAEALRVGDEKKAGEIFDRCSRELAERQGESQWLDHKWKVHQL